jgi:ribose transport system permease protein
MTNVAVSSRSSVAPAWQDRLPKVRDYGIVGALAALFVTLSLASPSFLTWANLTNILDQNIAVGLIAVGGTFVLIAGGFDLSVGAIYAVTGVAAAQLVPHIGPEPALVAGVLIGLGFGVINGLVSTIGKVNPFVTTLGTSIIISGIALIMTKGFLVTVDDETFSVMGRDGFGEVKYSVVLWLTFALLSGFILARTGFGSKVYAAGGNAEAARLAGIRVAQVRTMTFAISGMSAGLAGVLVASKIGQAQADTGGYTLAFAAIAAIVIGGTSILGGEGAIWRTMVGVLLLALIGNGFNLLNVDTNYQDIFRGSIIIAAVGLDAWIRRK